MASGRYDGDERTPPGRCECGITLNARSDALAINPRPPSGRRRASNSALFSPTPLANDMAKAAKATEALPRWDLTGFS